MPGLPYPLLLEPFTPPAQVLLPAVGGMRVCVLHPYTEPAPTSAPIPWSA